MTSSWLVSVISLIHVSSWPRTPYNSSPSYCSLIPCFTSTLWLIWSEGLSVFKEEGWSSSSPLSHGRFDVLLSCGGDLIEWRREFGNTIWCVSDVCHNNNPSRHERLNFSFFFFITTEMTNYHHITGAGNKTVYGLIFIHCRTFFGLFVSRRTSRNISRERKPLERNTADVCPLQSRVLWRDRHRMNIQDTETCFYLFYL